MKRNVLFSLFSLVCLCFMVSSCKKESAKFSGQAQFVVSASDLKSSLKSGVADTLNLSYVLFTIEDASGNVVKNSEKVELYNMNGDYISKPVSLVKGSYKLTGFMVLDSKNNIVYASPLKGSAKAYLVQEPLPISFDILRNGVTKLMPEVISTVNCKPEDFGYVTFGLNVVKTFDFLIGTFIYNDNAKNFELTTAVISILSDIDTIYKGQLNAPQSGSPIVTIYDSIGVTNKITLSEKYNQCTLVISKSGYTTYRQTFTKEELKLHFKSTDKGPLVVILERSTINDGLVAYYHFNGDVLDYSGNNNNGTYYGRGVYGIGNKSDNQGAIDLNGSSDYVYIKNSPSLSPTTQISISSWYYAVPFYGNGANTIVCKENIISPPASLYHLAVQGNLYLNNPVFLFNVTTTLGPHPISTSGIFQYAMYQWYFVVGVYDGNNTKLYVNGSLEASETQTGNILNIPNNIYIGNSEGLIRPQYDFTAGRIDEVRIYNRALSQAEIVSLYKQ